MRREDYIKRLIKEQGLTIKEFARIIGMPYSTLLSMLGGSMGGAAVESVIRICRGLGITIADLQSRVELDDRSFALTDQERLLVERYRLRTELQPAIHKLLDLPPR